MLRSFLHDHETETLDELTGYGLRIVQPRHGYRFSVDPLLLADFAGVRRGERVADLGTGSGAIALALAAERPHWQVVAVDRSAAALAVARANAEHLGLAGRVHCVQADWCAPLAPAGCDLIVANPPYLAADDPHLPALRHEPRSALVAGPTGLEDLARIIHEAAASLAPEGWLLLEHGWDQGQAVQDLLTAAGYRTVTGRQDFAGHDRIGLGQRPHP